MLIEALGNTALNQLFDIGFNKEIVIDDAMYRRQVSGDLAKLINKSDEMSSEAAEKMGRKSMKHIAKQYIWEEICKQYKNIFMEETR